MIHNSIIRLDWPDKLHTPNRVSVLIFNKSTGSIYPSWTVQTSFIESEGRCNTDYQADRFQWDCMHPFQEKLG